jgi:hypothetical protein
MRHMKIYIMKIYIVTMAEFVVDVIIDEKNHDGMDRHSHAAISSFND